MEVEHNIVPNLREKDMYTMYMSLGYQCITLVVEVIFQPSIDPGALKSVSFV
jgi:hypothetical protein